MAFRPLLALLFCTIAIPQSRAEETPIDLGNERARFSYAIGYQIGSGLVRDQLDIDVEALSEAIGDAIAGIARLSREEQIAAIDAYRTRQLDQQNRQAVVNVILKCQVVAITAVNRLGTDYVDIVPPVT